MWYTGYRRNSLPADHNILDVVADRLLAVRMRLQATH
jgi:hypothetical protein